VEGGEEGEAADEQQGGLGGVDPHGLAVESLEFGGAGVSLMAEGFHLLCEIERGGDCAQGGEAQEKEEEVDEEIFGGEAPGDGGGEDDGGEEELIALEGDEEEGSGLGGEGVVVLEEGEDAEKEGDEAAEPEGPGDEGEEGEEAGHQGRL
jgi:hypothetical protein